MKTFIDTGGWIAVVVEVDRYHDLATLHFNELLSRHEKLFTSDFVLERTSFTTWTILRL